MAYTDKTAPKPIVLTQGDPSGIGPEITLRAWHALRQAGPRFVVIGDPALYADRASLLGIDVAVAETDLAGAAGTFDTALRVIASGQRARGKAGIADVGDAASTLAAIDQAVDAIREGAASSVVTNPIAKHVLYQAGFRHPGHTEYLGELAHSKWGVAARPVMMIWSDDLAVVPVTIHIPLSSVASRLTSGLIEETARIVDRDLRNRFGIVRPRIACTGLNPHAGEDGNMGREEIEVIVPALERLRAEGMAITGPFPADTMFHAAARRTYDVALTMYHDQGLIPVKTLSFDTGVNVTLGLPFIRTSPDHGTAFDIAAKGIANPSSLIASIRLAGRLAAVSPGHFSP